MDSTLTKDDFTSNEEFDALTVGDSTVTIIGYVDCVEGTKIVGKDKKSLYKCIINNDNGRRIRFLIWEERVPLYEQQIRSREIIHIERAIVLKVNQQYAKASDNVVPFEISTHRLTTIKLLGKYSLCGIEECQIEYRTVEIKYIADATGNVSVQGFIKLAFEKEVSGFSTYGVGAITDGMYKLRVHIAILEFDDALCAGVHIQVQGILKYDGFGSIYLQAQCMKDIQIVDNKTMPSTQLRQGFRTSMKKPLEGNLNGGK